VKVNGVAQEEIQRGMAFRGMDLGRSGYLYGRDIARSGTFLFPYEVFGPVDGEWPKITLEITRIDRPERPVILELERATVEQIWLDFEPYREQKAARGIARVD
jgi:hypothetical protein